VHHIPTNCRGWVDTTLANFSELRSYLDSCSIPLKIDRVPIPTMKDRSAWHVVCVGLDEARGNIGAYFDDHDDHEVDLKQEWSKLEPTTQLLLQMDQVMIRRVFSHLVYYVQEGWPPSSLYRAKWLYALLARLDRPIHREDAAYMYSLLKSLTQRRAQLAAAERAELARVNTLIVIIGIYFEQGGGYASLMQLPL